MSERGLVQRVSEAWQLHQNKQMPNKEHIVWESQYSDKRVIICFFGRDVKILFHNPKTKSISLSLTYPEDLLQGTLISATMIDNNLYMDRMWMLCGEMTVNMKPLLRLSILKQICEVIESHDKYNLSIRDHCIFTPSWLSYLVRRMDSKKIKKKRILVETDNKMFIFHCK